MTVYPMQALCIAVISVTPFIAALFVGLRFYSRRRNRVKLSWDDYLIILAVVLSIALIAPSVRNVYMWNYGIRYKVVIQKKLPIEPDFDEYHKVLLSYNLINTPILPLVKASIIILLFRIGSVVTKIRRALYVIFVFNALACVGPWIALIFHCPLRTGETTAKTVFGGLKCLSKHQGGIVYCFLVTANMFTDLLILPIPTLLIWRLQNTNLRLKITAIASFALSLGVTAMSAVRLKLNYEAMLFNKNPNDWTYSGVIYCLTHAENNVAIIVACMPTIRSLVMSWITRKQEDTLPKGTELNSDSRRFGGPLLTGHSGDIKLPGTVNHASKTSLFGTGNSAAGSTNRTDRSFDFYEEDVYDAIMEKRNRY